jgi:hypothetical protein
VSLTIKFDDYPRIEFSEAAWDHMWYLVDKVDTEVGWLGLVKRLSPFTFRIEEVFVPPQDVNGGTTEMQAEDMPAFLMALQDERHPGIVNELTMWMHSHASMGITRSGQDMAQWGKWKGDFAKRNLPSIAGRANKKGEIECELYLPEFGLEIEGIIPTLEALPVVREPWQDEMDALIKANVRPKTYTYTKGSWSGVGGTLLKPGGQPVPEFEKKEGSPGKYLGGGARPNVVVGHAERTRLASQYGLKHYNSLTTDDQKQAWLALTEEIAELVDEAVTWGTVGSSLRFDVAHAMSDYQDEDILTQEGERFMLDTALEEELTGGYYPMTGGYR